MKTRAMTIKAKTRDSLSARVRSNGRPPAPGSRNVLPRRARGRVGFARLAGLAPAGGGSGRDRRPIAVPVGADRGATRRGCCACAVRRPRPRWRRACAGWPLCHADDCTEAQAMSLLRKAKQETALIIALADLAGEFDVVAATRALSRAADRLSPRRCASPCGWPATGWRSPTRASPTANCGLVVLALGKHGAMELNYSSDVDLVVFYDAAFAGPRRGAGGQGQFAADHPASGQAAARAHRRRLCAARRPAAAARSRLDRRGGVARRRAALLRDARPELGARRHDQGAPGRGRSCAGLRLPRRDGRLHLAQIFRLRGHRRHPCDEAPDPRGQGPCRNRCRRP